MSLKYFHFIVITASWLLAFGFSAWCFFSSQAVGIGYVIGGFISFLIGISLLFYHVWVWKKMRHLPIG